MNTPFQPIAQNPNRAAAAATRHTGQPASIADVASPPTSADDEGSLPAQRQRKAAAPPCP
jgi:hypothetical protein